ncbi:DUF6538 domain-containing protein [Cupriavidus sp. AU9028]|uniref:DUF6538 domain-containing protein n=1 Tax=Cupriavidus sp. AU9028 TaxID=2871157 RepID=UPI00351D20DC
MEPPARRHGNRYGILYFRQRIPDGLRSLFPVKEAYRSLDTASVREAAAHLAGSRPCSRRCSAHSDHTWPAPPTLIPDRNRAPQGHQAGAEGKSQQPTR